MAPKAPSEGDILFNQASVLLAKSQKVIGSWLPPRTEEEQIRAEEPEESAEAEAEASERLGQNLGLGAVLPRELRDGVPKQIELSGNEKLRRQLLGKDAAKARPVSPKQSSSKSEIKTRSPMPTQNAKRDESSEDDEAGRAASFKSKRLSKHGKFKNGRSDIVQETGRNSEIDLQTNGDSDLEGRVGTKRTRPTNYLDEVIAERRRRKKKKKT